MNILVVDDDVSITLTLAGFLGAQGHTVATASNGREAFERMQRGDYRVVITDKEMPDVDGLELCQRIRAQHHGAYVYVILLTSHDAHNELIQALDAGADDFLTKPFQPDELIVRLKVAERIISLESRDLVIFALARLAESRDTDTGAHLERIREYGRLLAETLAQRGPFQKQVDADFVRSIYLTSPLHDIGKVGISDAILLKPGKLTESEFEVMKTHTELGRATLEDALEAHPNAVFLKVARDIAWCHHERFDGTGYPRGLRGYAIPLSARITTVCDVYDALTSERPYKSAFPHSEAIEVIANGRGSHFDPDIVDAFLHREKEFDAIRIRLADATVGKRTRASKNTSTEPVIAPPIASDTPYGLDALNA